MKKKGLIISTIVMVVVLIASLTTATYAWFNANAAAKVSDVTVSVASTSNISIGIAKDGTNRDKATSYVNGTIQYTEASEATDASKGLGTFSSRENKAGLGLNVAWDNWALSTKGGVSSSADGTTFDVKKSESPAYVPTNALYNGTEETTGVTTNVKVNGKATFNAQGTAENPCTVIYAPFGLRVEKANLTWLYCDITITPDEGNAFWGIVTALKIEINDGTNTWYYRPFAKSEASDTPKATVAGVGLMDSAITYGLAPNGTESPTSIKLRFVIAHCTTTDDSSTTAIDEGHLLYGATSNIYQFNLRMFIDGEDPNCIADATQYSATIGLEFDAKGDDYATTGITKVVTLS